MFDSTPLGHTLSVFPGNKELQDFTEQVSSLEALIGDLDSKDRQRGNTMNLRDMQVLFPPQKGNSSAARSGSFRAG